MNAERTPATSEAIAVRGVLMWAAIAVGVSAVWLLGRASSDGSWVLAALFVTNLVCLFASLSKSHPLGVAFGLAVWGIQVIGWTAANPGPILVAVQLGLIMLLFLSLIMAKGLITDTRLGRWFPFWVGVLPPVPGFLGALFGGALFVAVGRSVSIVLAFLWLLVTLRHDARRLAWGVVTGTHLIMILPLTCGLLSPISLPRFWGGTCAQMAPNLLGLAAWTTAIAWIALPGRQRLARVAGAVFGALLILQVDSRSSAGAGLVAVSVLWAMSRHVRGMRVRWAGLLRVGVAAALLISAGLVLASGFFLRERAANVGALSGRQRIWSTALADFRAAPPIVKILGTSEGGIGARIDYLPGQTPPAGRGWSTDSAVITLLRRSGIIGLILGTVGLVLTFMTIGRGLIMGHRATAALLAGAIVTIPVEDFFLGLALFGWVCIAAALTLFPSLPPRETAPASMRPLRSARFSQDFAASETP